MGNFYRQKSIRNTVLRKLESCIDDGIMEIGCKFLCDDFEIEFHIVEIKKIG